jgi:hypothetical protein
MLLLLLLLLLMMMMEDKKERFLLLLLTRGIAMCTIYIMCAALRCTAQVWYGGGEVRTKTPFSSHVYTKQ